MDDAAAPVGMPTGARANRGLMVGRATDDDPQDSGWCALETFEQQREHAADQPSIRRSALDLHYAVKEAETTRVLVSRELGTGRARMDLVEGRVMSRVRREQTRMAIWRSASNWSASVRMR